MALAAVSVAVTVCGPPVWKVTGNVPVPAVSAALAGSTASASVLKNSTVPAYPASTLE
jgi:hypothetical protein